MATLTVQDVSPEGLTPTYDAADVAGDEFTYHDTAFLHVKNEDASDHTVTVVSQFDAITGVTAADVEVTVTAGEERMIGPFSRRYFPDADGLVQVTYDAVTDVTVAAIKL